jgi:hypothetical protein
LYGDGVELLEAIGGWKTVGGVAVGVIVLWALSRIFSSKQTMATHTRKRRCGQCGWAGDVSVHAPRCPKCNTAFDAAA